MVQTLLYSKTILKVFRGHAEKISGQEYKDYYFGHAYVMNGNFDKADEFLAKLQTPWMIHSLKAYAAHKRGNKEYSFDKKRDQSIESAIGMQRLCIASYEERFENGDFKI